MAGRITGPAATLVEELLTEHFGPIPSSVACTLLRRGDSAIFEIQDELKLPFWQIRNTLLVLIQHNVVSFAREGPLGANAPVKDTEQVRYHLLTDAVLHRIRYPTYADYVARERGRLARLLFTEVLKKGRTGIKSAVSCVLDELKTTGDPLSSLESIHLAEDKDEDDATLPEKIPSESSLRMEFVSLVAENWLVRVDDTTRASKPTEADNTPGAVHPNSNLKVDMPDVTKPKSKRNAATKSSAKRKRYSATNEIDPALSGLMDADPGSHSEVVKKRKVEEDETDKGSELKILMKEMENLATLYKINMSHLNLLLLREVAEEFMATRWGGSKAVKLITKALLASSRMQTNGVMTKGLAFDELHTHLEKYFQQCKDGSLGKLPDRNVLLKLLDALSRVDKVIRNGTRAKWNSSDGRALFFVDWTRLKEILQHRLLFNAICARHGNKGGRIWNYLIDSTTTATSQLSHIEMAGGKLNDDQQVADQVLLPPHAAREVLYALARDGFVRLHQSDVVTGAPASCSSKHAMVFASNEALVKSQLIRNTYTILLNLHERKLFEGREIATLGLSVIGLSETEGVELRRREAGEDKLEFSFLDLDKTLLILRDM